MKELEKENFELRRANEILKAAAAFFGAELDRRPPQIVAFIDEHRDRFGVEPICRVLTEHGCKIAPNTYWVAKKRPPSARRGARRGAEGRDPPRSGATTSRSMGPTRSGPSSTGRASAWRAAPSSA